MSFTSLRGIHGTYFPLIEDCKNVKYHVLSAGLKRLEYEILSLMLFLYNSDNIRSLKEIMCGKI